MQLAEYENINVELEIKDRVFLEKNHSKHIVVKSISEKEVNLKAKSFVGKIVLPSKKEIIIQPKIKINNLLYIISYTYDIVDFKYVEKRKLTENDALIEIYITVFLNWLNHLFKKGLFKNYQNFKEELSGLRGKIMINESLIERNKLVCEYYDISFSNIENKIIKATLLLIISQRQLEKQERERALIFYRRLKDIASLQLSNSNFNLVNINRLNKHYKPIIELCDLIFTNLRLSDENGKLQFSSFMMNLNSIYEKFLLKALQKRLKTEHVDVTKSRKSNWADSNDNFLPQLEPDIYIKNKAIVDAKYYKSPFTKNDKFISGHISQLVLYLKAYNISKGFLVYPESEAGKIDSRNTMEDLCFTMFSIPLNKEISDLNNSLDILAQRIMEK